MRSLRPQLGTVDVSIARVPPKEAAPYYLSPEWRALRRACLDRDGWRCVICGERGFIADHIISRRSGGPDALHNLRCLCRACDNRLKEGVGGQRRAQPPR